MIRKQANGQKANGLKKSKRSKKSEKKDDFLFSSSMSINFNFGLKMLEFT